MQDNNLTSAFVLTCVGSVKKAKLRMANGGKVRTKGKKQTSNVDKDHTIELKRDNLR